MIKIISGWSNPGGSTVAFINLCNLFNDKGKLACFYGPHTWHLGQCEASLLQNLAFSAEDKIIFHFINMDNFSGKSILSCHETNLAPLKELKMKCSNIHFVSESQKKWQGVEGVVIPNVVSKLRKGVKLQKDVAGVIGSIDAHKQTHISIQRALDDGWDKVKVFGAITDQRYFREHEDIFKDPRVQFKGVCYDKQNMYNQVMKVYHSSKRETFNYIKIECELTETEYDGLPSAESGAEYWEDDKIFESWMDLLDD